MSYVVNTGKTHLIIFSRRPAHGCIAKNAMLAAPWHAMVVP